MSMLCRGKGRKAILLAAFLCLGGGEGFADGARSKTEIIGIFVHGQEKTALDAVSIDGRYYLPADMIFGMIGVRAISLPDGIELRTPLGTTTVPPQAIHTEGGEQFVSEEAIADLLGMDIQFDEERYGLMVVPPWAEGAPIDEGDAPETPQGPFDAEPPALAISSIHGDIFQRIGLDGQEDSTRGVLDLYGNAVGGVWRLGFNSDFRESGELAEYAWLKKLSPTLWTQLGRQRVALHPLVGGADYTGAQLAWSNRPRDFYNFHGLSGGLLDRYHGGARRFFGEGPPGGRVELLIDDRLTEVGLVDVTGAYEIESRIIGAGRNDIEIRVFDPVTGALVGRETQVLTANALIAPEGSINAMAGIGVEGNAFDTDHSHDATGFLWGRYAPTDMVTLEAAAIAEGNDRLEATIGAGLQLEQYGTLYGAVASDEDGNIGYEGRYFGEYRNWTLRARARSSVAEDGNDGDSRENDHFAELIYRHTQHLRFGLLARDSDDATFVLPLAVWRPVEDMYLSARPNRFGDYQFEARASLDTDTDIRFFHEYDSSLRFRRTFDIEEAGPFVFTLDFERYDSDDTVGVFAGLSGFSVGDWPLRWRLRAGVRDERFAGSVGIDATVAPGVRAYAEASRGAFDDERGETTISLGLSFDLGFRNDGLVAANRFGVDPRKGRLAGRLNTPEGIELSPEATESARILVAGKPRGRIEPDGSFWLADLPEGAYDVDIEADRLPIELASQQESRRVRIAPGAVTTVDFPLTLSLGAGGRITGPDGAPLADTPVTVRNGAGETVAKALTSQFGLFRVDGLAPGTYGLSAATDWLEGTRRFVIEREYLFGVDLALTPATALPKENDQ